MKLYNVLENNTRWEDVGGGIDEIWPWVEVVETGWWEHGCSLYYYGYFGVCLKFSTNDIKDRLEVKLNFCSMILLHISLGEYFPSISDL